MGICCCDHGTRWCYVHRRGHNEQTWTQMDNSDWRIHNEVHAYPPYYLCKQTLRRLFFPLCVCLSVIKVTRKVTNVFYRAFSE